jgi:ABC-type polysaccharide/polyol phosphate transport system ATPase subunit
MTSTTPSEEILAIRRLNLVFRLRYHQRRTIRSAVLGAVRSPLDALVRAKDSLHVLKDIDLTVRKGDRLALLGVNGSGKTSLCRSIAGMFQPASGTVRLRGECRGIFDTHVGIIPELTGRENARLLARLMYPGIGEAQLRGLVDEAVAFSELGSFLDVPFETYSQGMQARIFLSVATALPTDLLILDEVYDNTDQFFQRKMTARLMDFIERSGAVIFVSHSPEHVRKICSRAVVLHQSRVAYDGTVDKAMEAYAFLNEGPQREEPRNA